MSAFSSSLRPALLAASLALSAVAAPAHAFADDDARRAILELREQVKQMQDRNQQGRLLLADQIESLQHQVATMRGQLEKMRWELDLSRGAQGQLGEPSVRVDNPQEQMAFDSPMGLFRSGKYQEASAGFTTFLTNYPNSKLVSEARFYQGSSMYANKDFKGSIQQLQALIQNAPQDPRAADALLIIAASQIELNDMNGAKASLQKIVADYPQTTAAETAKSRLQLLQ